MVFTNTFLISYDLHERAYNRELAHQKIEARPSHIQKSLVIDKSFDETEKVFIRMAAQEWTRATHGMVTFTYVNLPNINKSDIVIDENTLYIVKATENYPQIISLEVNKKEDDDSCILGYYDENSIINSILIVSSRLDDLSYQSVVMHELGHALGLKHIHDDKHALMYPSITYIPTNITQRDMVSFCKLYDCSQLEKSQ